MTETWTILKVLSWTKGYLAEKGVENARLEAEWMLCSALGIDRVGLYVNFDKPLTSAELSIFRAMVARRAKREPLQYILGSQEFYGLDFEVSPGVLIPRHDTEVLVREALARSPKNARILDMGVGSGCVAVALAKNLADAEIFGVDPSSEALALAARNAGRHAVPLHLLQGSLFEPVAGERFDLIVSNPPYIPTADLAGLQEEVREYEPRGALDGGIDGLDFYRRIIPDAPCYLKEGGWLLVEMGIGQAGEVLALFEETGRFSELFTATDAGGIERVAGGKKL
ncbi:MAG: peptide chain release factor N(5)-glutamine methyltransferase [Geobacteraceae bacterium]|nr:peptide chain release factor N(5)-glutamine methyltransferase [Geobacteraceae bacterium]